MVSHAVGDFPDDLKDLDIEEPAEGLQLPPSAPAVPAHPIHHQLSKTAASLPPSAPPPSSHHGPSKSVVSRLAWAAEGGDHESNPWEETSNADAELANLEVSIPTGGPKPLLQAEGVDALNAALLDGSEGSFLPLMPFVLLLAFHALFGCFRFQI